MVGYDGQTDQVLFFRTNSNVCYAYHIGLKRWDEYSNAFGVSDAVQGVFSGKDGESYVTTDGIDEDMYQYFGAGTKRTWVWIGPEYDLNDPSQSKMFDVINTDQSTATVTTTFGVGGANPTTAVASLSHNRDKTIQVKLAGDATAVCDSMSVVFRRMLGKR